jgi:hypothetical protein
MSKLIALLAVAGAVAAGLYFWRRNEQSWESRWAAKDSTSSWGTSAWNEAGAAADRVGGATDSAAKAASDLADELKRGASQATDKAGEAADSVAAAADSATEAASNLADEVKKKAS